MLRKEQKTAIIDANRTHEGDTGSPEVQVAILTERINVLTEHMRNNPQAVSYTHLDVYKRQGVHPAALCGGGHPQAEKGAGPGELNHRIS